MTNYLPRFKCVTDSCMNHGVFGTMRESADGIYTYYQDAVEIKKERDKFIEQRGFSPDEFDSLKRENVELKKIKNWLNEKNQELVEIVKEYEDIVRKIKTIVK